MSVQGTAFAHVFRALIAARNACLRGICKRDSQFSEGFVIDVWLNVTFRLCDPYHQATASKWVSVETRHRTVRP